MNALQAFHASSAQSRLWFLQQLEPDLTAYHMPAVWRLRGELDEGALERALGGLIERHGTLRSSFRLQGSEVLQLIHPPGAFALAVEELGERDGEEVIEEWLEEDRRTPFDLSSGMLLRARLLQVTAEEHVLLVNHHHIASDGWSRSVLARDLTELYNAQHGNREPRLAPLRVQYQDYAAWQRQRLSGERLRKLTQYWIGELEGLEPLELPGDRARPAMPSHRGGSVSFEIGAELLQLFEELCRREGATLQMGLLAVVALLLHRYSRQDDFAIGVPIWGRNHPDLELLMGFFINTLPVRTRFAAGQSFRELLAQVRERSIGAYEHQELPFEQMVEALNVERDTSRNPLVQVMVQLMELPESTLQNCEDLEVESLPTKSESSKLDLSFYLRRGADGGLRGSIAYARDLFDGERIERLSRHLQTLLRSALQTPDAAAEALNLLPEAERELIESWQEGPRIELPEVCVHQLFEQQVERTPEATALVFEDQELSYAELNARANQLAHHLRDLGVGPEVIVGVCLERSVELIVSLLAILKAGGAYLPLDPEWPESRTGLVLNQASCQYMIGSKNEARMALEGGTICFIGVASDAVWIKSADNLQSRPESVGGLAYVIFTSGSTGTPKGIEITHRVATLKCLSVCREWGLTGSEAILGLSSFGFDISLRETIFPLTKGCVAILASESQRMSPGGLAMLVSDRRITRIQATPSHWEELVSCGLHGLNSSRLIAIGESLKPSLAARLCEKQGVSLLHLYGTTEAPGCAGISYERVRDSAAISIGRPLHNTTILILDGALRSCPIGVPGELHIGGAGLARGYLNQPELTAEKFIPDPLSSDPAARLYKSGDLASWNPDGTLAFHGRIDQQIKLRGFRIEPGEIEANLLEHPAVSQAVVVLRQDDPSNPRLIAYWVPEKGAAGADSAEKLRSFLAERLPEYMVPAGFVELESLPLTSNGKLNRKALPEPSFAGDLERRVEPTSELERTLYGIWTEVLGHGEFGITDNFFAVGGHSLAAVRLVTRIEQAFGRGPSLAAVFQSPTIAGLAALVESADWSTEGNEPATAIPMATPIPFELP
ncbi:amino acid adenylation domain-containing protein [Cyanobium sp. ATX 6A2]|uniref:non-ribosomal peptide synthetase n=1 Tax=Cyanobium sp. ATX 6A2 TaxID=2823700 RepID=UPI0020CBF693|nr:amino acid adenylation domain-containing protein [Cyanobium sp. ATX 6A2]MCP9888742.1 amino acid adenylation domain-containing protein [Cyanobium sp. ATX 6A2]